MELSVKRIIERWIDHFLLAMSSYIYCVYLSNNIFNASTDFLFLISIPFLIWIAFGLDDVRVERYARFGDITAKQIIYTRIEMTIESEKTIDKTINM